LQNKNDQTMNWIIKSYTGLLVLVLLTTSMAKAQNFQDDYNKVLENFSNANTIDMQASIKIFREASDKQPEFVQNCTMKRSAEKTFCAFDQVVMVCNGKQTLLVNKAEGVMAIQNVKGVNKNNTSVWDEESMKALGKVNGNHRLIKDEGVTRTYEIRTSNDPIEKTIVRINVRKHTIEQLTYFYNKQLYSNQQKVEINYGVFDTEANFDRTTFAFSNYVTKKNNQYQPTDQYKQYQLQMVGSLDFQ